MYYNLRGEPCTRKEWFSQFGDENQRRLARTFLDEYMVSTVWLGIDHRFVGDGPPILWETMIFSFGDDPLGVDGRTWRYDSSESALTGHYAVVTSLRGGQAPLGALDEV